jgi:hypothetical protein
LGKLLPYIPGELPPLLGQVEQAQGLNHRYIGRELPDALGQHHRRLSVPVQNRPPDFTQRGCVLWRNAGKGLAGMETENTQNCEQNTQTNRKPPRGKPFP